MSVIAAPDRQKTKRPPAPELPAPASAAQRYPRILDR